MFCTNCGKKIEDDSKFCEHCGNSIEDDLKKETSVKNENSIFSSDTQQKNPIVQSSVKNIYIWKWIIAIIIICIIMTLFFIYKPYQPTVREIAQDGRFIAYDNETVLDRHTRLMWAAKDNGSDINWANAKSYCENYRGGGYTDWRMPTPDELEGLYDAGKSQQLECKDTSHVATDLIHLTSNSQWASETDGSNGAYFLFNIGSWHWYPLSHGKIDFRVLPVRSGK